MNEKLNLVEILKDCPKGTKLYSPSFGEVEFESIDLSLYDMGKSNAVRANFGQPVVVRVGSCHYEYFTADGRYDVEIVQQECMIFPSRDVRTWDNFKPKKPKFDPKTLQPFDKVLVKCLNNSEWLCNIFSHIEPHSNFCFCANYTDEYIAVYESTNFTPIITVKVFTKRIGLCEIGKSRLVYYFMGKSYRSKASLIKAINELKANNE